MGGLIYKGHPAGVVYGALIWHLLGTHSWHCLCTRLAFFWGGHIANSEIHILTMYKHAHRGPDLISDDAI